MTGKFKIAILSAHSCPAGELGSRDTGGMNVYIRELARELGRQGHLVDVYARAHDPTEPQITELGKNVRLIHLTAGEVGNIHKLVVYSYLDDFACSLENFRKRNGLNYDLIHSHYWLSGWVGKRVQGWWKVPHIIMFHTLGAVKNAIGVGEDEPELRTQTEKELVKNCHCIIAATEREKRQLIEYYDAPPEIVNVIPCGVNLELFQPINKEAARQRLGLNGNGLVLFVGRIEPLKGLDKLLMAMTYLEKRHEARLIIIGGDEYSQPEVDRLLKSSEKLHIQDRVTFMGKVRQEELPSYYSAADVCVIPSYYESFGLVALESLACGTPIVATDVGGINTIVTQGKSGYMITKNDPSLLASKIGALLLKSKDGSEAARSIRATVTAFSWVNIAQEITNRYQKVLGNYHTLGI